MISTCDVSASSNVFSVDVEDYFQVQAFERIVDRDDWATYGSRVVDNTNKIADALEENSVLGTFFVLGWVAEKQPQLVKRIAKDGHEIACHSYWHRQVTKMTKHEFQEDLHRATVVLEDLIGEKVTSFRAPSFSLALNMEWAWETLLDEGYSVDSSIFPIAHDRYGDRTSPRFPYHIRCGDRSILEFPPTTLRLLGMNLPVAGGGYFRLLPSWFSRFAFHQVRRTNQPLMFYIHPWEIDPDQPRLPCRMLTRWRHYLGLRRTQGKIKRLLQSFRFGRLKDAALAMV